MRQQFDRALVVEQQAQRKNTKHEKSAPREAALTSLTRRPPTSDNMQLWVPKGMCKPSGWVNVVDSMADADVILCNISSSQSFIHASMIAKLSAKLYRQRLVDLDWLGGQGRSKEHPPRNPKVRRILIHWYATPAARSKHSTACALLEGFVVKSLQMKNQKQNVRFALYTVVMHRSVQAFFGALKVPKPGRLCNDYLVCSSSEISELRELAAFNFGQRKDSSLIERCVCSFHDFVRFL